MDANARLQRAFAAESRRRLKTITVARTIALVCIAVIILIVSPIATLWYYYSLVAVFIALGWVQLTLARSRYARAWHQYAFVAVDFALIVFTLIYPAPNSPPEIPPQFYLRFGNFNYLYVLLASLAITLRPALQLWGGLCGALFWSIGVAWLASRPGVRLEPVAEEATVRSLAVIETVADPNFIDLGVQFQSVVIFLIVASLLALTTEASLRLTLRQMTAERRAANLSRYLPAAAVEDLAARDDPFSEERDARVAVLFTDLVAFSSFAERRSPHEVIGLLREAHEMVETAVFEHGGVLDKFIGDGAMATFGASGERPDDAARAVACVRSLVQRAADWNEARRSRGLSPVALSVGLHFGPVVVGDVGSSRRMELAVIGDTVNVAARLEQITRMLRVSAAVSDEAMAAAGRPDGFADGGLRQVKGRDDPVRVWTL